MYYFGLKSLVYRCQVVISIVEHCKGQVALGARIFMSLGVLLQVLVQVQK
jgi:hypothetical protein